ncbi:MAG TPA: hypothetical protein VLB44_21260 [Kofleriaceae bacterium]|nr:hypothetical protein [Kofleriaceae bacterium]
MTTLTTTEQKLAIKVGKAKHPRTTLQKEVGEDFTDVLWRMLAAGAVSFRGDLADAAGSCAEKARLEHVWAAARQLDESALREESVKWGLTNSYRKHSSEWERELPNLPQIARDLVAGARHTAGIEIDDADRERVLEVFATAAVDKAHTYHHLLWQDAETLGESRADFGRRVLRHLAAMPEDARLVNQRDVLDALAVASWDVLAPLLKRLPSEDRDDSDLLDILRERDDAPALLFEVLERDEPLPLRVAELLLLRATSRGEAVPTELDAILVEGLAEGRVCEPETTAAIEALPAPRLKKLVAALRKTSTENYSCAGLLKDKALDDKIVAEIVEAFTTGIEQDDASESTLESTFADLLAAGQHGIQLIDRALAVLDEHAGYNTWFWAPRMRLLCRRVQFLMSRGSSPRRLDLVMPGADLDAVDDVRDAIGHVENPLQGLTRAEIDSLMHAWRPYDWDGQLHLDTVFGDQPPPPSIEERPWQELADLVAVTAFRRLAENKALARVFDRPEPLAAKVALAEKIALRANVHLEAIWPLRGMMNVFAALLPHVNAVHDPLTGELELVAKRLLAAGPSDEVRDLLLALPLAQVTGWIDEMRANRSTKIKRLATTYAKLLPA